MSIFGPIPRYEGPLPPGVEFICWPDDIDRRAWLQMRQLGVGGSDAAALFRASTWEPGEPKPYSTPLQLYRGKLATIKPQKKFALSALIGLHMERLIAHLYAEQMNARIVLLPMVRRDGWMVSNPDLGIVANDDPYRLIRGAELKRPILKSKPKWENNNAPLDYVVQSHWYMNVWQVPRWDLYALIGDDNPVLRQQDRDDELAELLVEMASAWWHGNVLARIPPPAMDHEEERDLIRLQWSSDRQREEWYYAEASDDEIVERIVQYKREIKVLEAKVKGLENQIARKSVGYAGVRGAGWRGKWTERRSKPDWKGIAQELGLTEEFIDAHRAPPTHSFSITTKE